MIQGQLIVESWAERVTRLAREMKAARADIGHTESNKLQRRQLERYRRARFEMEAVLTQVPDD